MRKALKPMLGIVLFLVVVLVGSISSEASHTPDPSSVTIAGSLQSEAGCPGDWQPNCAITYLTYDGEDDVWQAAFNIPVGSWEYKGALNDSWDENYGAGAIQDGPNIGLSLALATDVKFYYDHKSHWLTDNENSIIVVAVGDFQTELGCFGDWDPGCLRSWLQDPDGDSTYTFSTAGIPAGSYEAKAAIGESWDENYGAGGIPGGPNIEFYVGEGDVITFEYDAVSHVLGISGGSLPPTPEEATQSLIDAIEDLAPSAFSGSNRQSTLVDKVNEALALIQAGDLASICEAIDKLSHDLLPKTDGVSPPPDWVVDPTAQVELADQIASIIDDLQSEADELGGCP